LISGAFKGIIVASNLVAAGGYASVIPYVPICCFRRYTLKLHPGQAYGAEPATKNLTLIPGIELISIHVR